MKASEGILHNGTILRPVPRGYIPRYHRKDGKYFLDEDVYYYSTRYNRGVLLKKGDDSDGATGAFDIKSLAWWVHDELCKTGVWQDGAPITNWQASRVLSDILYDEGRRVRSKTWFWATFYLGCKGARKNGMFRRKK